MHGSGLHSHLVDRQHCDKSDACEFSVPEVTLRSGHINNSGALLYCSNYCGGYCCGSPLDGVIRWPSARTFSVAARFDIHLGDCRYWYRWCCAIKRSLTVAKGAHLIHTWSISGWPPERQVGSLIATLGFLHDVVASFESENVVVV